MEWNFEIVDGEYANYEEIHDDFVRDYIYSSELTNLQIRTKYKLSYPEFLEIAKRVREEYGIKRRPKAYQVPIRNFTKVVDYKGKEVFRIEKNGVYYGVAPSKKVAEKIVEKCHEADWDVPRCRAYCKNWKMFVEMIYIKRNCCTCYDCLNACVTGALSATDEGYLTWDKSKCTRCECCIDECVNDALYLE